VLVIVLAGAFIWSVRAQTNYYSITPGLAQPVGPLITVNGHPHATDRSSIYLTDVELTQLSYWDWMVASIPPVHEQIVQLSQVIGNVPAAQLTAQGYLEMYDSQNDAKVAGMQALRLPVIGTPVGAAVTAVVTNAPSSKVLSVDDRIVWANGHHVTSGCGLIAALATLTPGQPVRLKVEHVSVSPSGVFGRYGPPVTVVTPTSDFEETPAATGCPPTAEYPDSFASPLLGIGLENAVNWTFPVRVSINTADIGGPSAGLAMTLGIIDALSVHDITGSIRLAATGTMSPDGAVGDVGGVAEKTIAVETAGATVFLVPTVELKVAQQAASGGLKVYAIATLQQALALIKRLSGVTPVPIVDTSTKVHTS
jgi:Lon-like protease